MSGRPDEQGAAALVEVLAEMEALDAEIARHRQAIDAMKPTIDRLSTAINERAALERRLRERLEAMDCDSTGNFGWSSRFGWLLATVVRMSRAKA